MPIRFFYEAVDFKLKNPRKKSDWIKFAIKKEKKSISEVNFVFCDDKMLLSLNQDFLQHNTLTDIISFDYSMGKMISGEIFISIERVRENAVKFKTPFLEELSRVMIHGILHFCGYKDKMASDKVIMRKKEQAYLSLQKKMFHVKQ